jgi:hypothetical protein
MIDTEVEANSVPNSSGKLFATIGDDITWYTTFANYVFEQHSFYLWGVDLLTAHAIGHHSG